MGMILYAEGVGYNAFGVKAKTSRLAWELLWRPRLVENQTPFIPLLPHFALS
jgi:hypothetical protein